MSQKKLVIKFGGTSVSSRETIDTIVSVVRDRMTRYDLVCVVVSALAGVSNLLQGFVERRTQLSAEAVFEEIRDLHLKLADELDLNKETLVASGFESELKHLESQLKNSEPLFEEAMPPMLQAKILACGELMSTRLLHAYLSRPEILGKEIAWWDVREGLHGRVDEEMTEHQRYLSATCEPKPDKTLVKRLSKLGRVVLTQGFIASDSEGRTQVLGRGGSDTSAAYLAVLLQANQLEIWTDVPGMFSANPKEVSCARLLRQLDYAEAQEIATMGARVLHPRCVRPCERHDIPIQVGSTLHPAIEGTRIGRISSDEAMMKAISVKRGITLVAMETLGMWQQAGFLADAFGCFKRHGISIDLVSTSETNVTVSLDKTDQMITEAQWKRLFDDLGQYCRVTVIEPCASVSLVGRHVRRALPRLGRAFQIFEQHRLHLMSQAANDLNLTFVVNEGQAERIVEQLHELIIEHQAGGDEFGESWQQLFGKAEAKATISGFVEWWRAAKVRERLLELVRENGPVFAYNKAIVDERIAALQKLKSVDRILYAVKANNYLPLLQYFHKSGLGLECVSLAEIEYCLKSVGGIKPSDILFTPNFAPRSEYEQAMAQGVRVTLDNIYPLEQWPEVFKGRSLFLRIDPGIGRGHHEHVRTAGSESKFGIPLAQIDRVVELVKQHGIVIEGLHAHTGSGISTADNWVRNGKVLLSLLAQFPSVKVVDVGGGLGIAEKPGDPTPDIAAIDDALAELKAQAPHIAFWIEPGRYLVSEAGVLLARVTQQKGKGEQRYLGIETGMNSLIRPALYGAYHHIVNLTRIDDKPSVYAQIVGPICESGDKLGVDRPMPETREGDCLLIANCGAYGATMSSHYNMRAPAVELLI